ncbi:hypothetical protein PVK06_012089 [Gossypium arboreum]|uniref:Uncharacterized protein n=1 Tax=Gossypium arboreum TaxID=29729 RepID=A0ABR0QAN3_GOSAR|nr:hypothetical protein PVK06_012089 [Gossypium arboreum]
MDNDVGPSIAPTQSLGPSTAPTQSLGPSTTPTQLLGPTLQPTTPISQPFQIMPVLWQVGMHGPVHLYSRLLQVNRGSIGSRCMRDRMRHCWGVLIFTNPHRLMGFKHLRYG